jgi:hypothetical protein
MVIAECANSSAIPSRLRWWTLDSSEIFMSAAVAGGGFRCTPTVHGRSSRAHEPDQFVAAAAGAASTRTFCPATAMSERVFSAARSGPITIDGDWRTT